MTTRGSPILGNLHLNLFEIARENGPVLDNLWWFAFWNGRFVYSYVKLPEHQCACRNLSPLLPTRKTMYLRNREKHAMFSENYGKQASFWIWDSDRFIGPNLGSSSRYKLAIAFTWGELLNENGTLLTPNGQELDLRLYLGLMIGSHKPTNICTCIYIIYIDIDIYIYIYWFIYIYICTRIIISMIISMIIYVDVRSSYCFSGSFDRFLEASRWDARHPGLPRNTVVDTPSHRPKTSLLHGFTGRLGCFCQKKIMGLWWSIFKISFSSCLSLGAIMNIGYPGCYHLVVSSEALIVGEY